MMIVILIRTLDEGSVVGWMQSVTSWDEEGDSDSSCGGQHYGLFPMFLVRLGGELLSLEFSKSGSYEKDLLILVHLEWRI